MFGENCIGCSMAKNCQQQRDFIARVVADDAPNAKKFKTLPNGTIVGFVRKSFKAADEKFLRHQLYGTATNWLERLGYDDSHLPDLSRTL